MEISAGAGGWVRVTDDRLPGPLYLRLQQDEAARWRTTELYVDGRGGPVTAAMLRELPLAEIEALVLAEAERFQSRGGIGPDLSLLAAHYGTSFGGAARHWVAESMRAQQAGSGVRRPAYPRDDTPAAQRRKLSIDQSFRLDPPASGLTDVFLMDVAKAYGSAVARGERPNVALAAQTGYPRRTVERWVYVARQRGFLPAGRKGAVN